MHQQNGYGQAHCAACRQPLYQPVQQTQHGLMHGACAFQWAAPRTQASLWTGVAVAVACVVILVVMSRFGL